MSNSVPRPLLTFFARFSRPLCTGASGGLRWICPNHLRRCWTSFSSIGATPTLSRISSFRTRSFLVWPHIHLNMRISATPNCWTCRLLAGQHSTIQYCGSNRRPIEFACLVIENARNLAQLHPFGFDSMAHIFINTPILLQHWPQILKGVLLRHLLPIKANLNSSYLAVLKLHPMYLVFLVPLSLKPFDNNLSNKSPGNVPFISELSTTYVRTTLCLLITHLKLKFCTENASATFGLLDVQMVKDQPMHAK